VTLITIRFSPNKRNKPTIDFESNHTVYEAVETIYKLHNHALNYGNKYTLEITISEDQQEVLIDEIPIGTTDKLNVFSFLENHINQVYDGEEEDSEELDFLLKLIETMRQEYQAEQMTSNIYQSVTEQEEHLLSDIDSDKHPAEALDDQVNDDTESNLTKQSYYYKGIKAIVLGLVIMIIVYGGYQIVTTHADSLKAELFEEYLAQNKYKEALEEFPTETNVIERDVLLDAIQKLNNGSLKEALKTSKLIENKDLNKLIHSTYQSNIDQYIRNGDLALAKALSQEIENEDLTEMVAEAYSNKIIKLIKEGHLTEAEELINESNDESLTEHIETYRQLETELKELNTQLEKAEDDKKDEIKKSVEAKQNQFNQFKEGL
jgi:hypothetical protein